MAKKITDKQQGSKLQWFFLVIIIPIVFAITLAWIVLTLLGVNVTEQAGKYVSKVPGMSQSASVAEEENTKSNKKEVQSSLDAKNEEIELLEEELSAKQTEIDELEQKVVKLEADVKSAQEVKEEKPENEKVMDMAASFQQMEPEEAAPIVENMSQDLAIQVLENVASEERGLIFGQMSPEAAAGIAGEIINSSEN
ncbi:MotE family protein [Halobacillus sp. B29]|uniref:MotE family protein n=1 Tax=Halobacillus sp. B29 TaxID=3457432 RepID=UPI003FCD4CDD